MFVPAAFGIDVQDVVILFHHLFHCVQICVASHLGSRSTTILARHMESLGIVAELSF